jgi:hypothetical protein
VVPAGIQPKVTQGIVGLGADLRGIATSGALGSEAAYALGLGFKAG